MIKWLFHVENNYHNDEKKKIINQKNEVNGI